ncbi:MAG: helix-turn-helix transcriptional regulator [Bacteroidales bacterium]|nr:helix-turn-helix transcriptional regulator [Bacteroidales bacterium]
MYSGKTQATLAKALFISEATYSRKENGLMKFERQEALKIGKLLGIKEDVILGYWMSDKIYDLMKDDKELVYKALKIVESNFENYNDCVEIPCYNNSYSNVSDRKQRKRKKF